jgi:alpha-L-fucosidase 2
MPVKVGKAHLFEQEWTMNKHSLQHKLVIPAPINRWDEAIPLGNGLIGALLWGDSSNIQISLDRGDCWDLRSPPEYKRSDFNWKNLKQLVAEKDLEAIRTRYSYPYLKCPYPTKLRIGRIGLHLSKIYKANAFNLDIFNALGAVNFDKGIIESFIDAKSPVGMIRLRGIEGIFKLYPPPYGEKQDAKEDKFSGGHVSLLGYPASVSGGLESMQWFVQECAEGFKYAVVIGQSKCNTGDCDVAFTIASTNDGTDPLLIGQKRVSEALTNGFAAMFEEHKLWWHTFWSKSEIDIPDKSIEQHYYLVQYYYGAASRRGMPAMPLQGLWTADENILPPWKGDYHHDLNTQMSYWAYLTANHLDEGACFLDFLWDRFDVAKTFANEFYGTTGACYPSVMGFDGQPLGGWPQYSLSPTNNAWLAHQFYLHWRYTLDTEFLRQRAYPMCMSIAQCLVGLLEPDVHGKLKLPLSTSPEIHDDQLAAWVIPNSNYDLALMRWLLKAVAEMADTLGFGADAAWSNDIYDKLDDLAIDDISFDGSTRPGSLKIAPDESLTVSHRHFSHIMAIYPLGTLHIENTDYDNAVIDASLRHLDMLGTGLWVGFSFTWMACIAARCGKPERALMMLQLFLKAFVSRNGFHLNGDYKNLGISSWNYRPFTLEANFAAAQAVHEMLLQSWNGTVRIFPAMPEDWLDASFENLRAEGAFLISAKRRAGNTIWIHVVAERDGVLRLRNPFKTANVEWNTDAVQRHGDDYILIMEKQQVLEGYAV